MSARVQQQTIQASNIVSDARHRIVKSAPPASLRSRSQPLKTPESVGSHSGAQVAQSSRNPKAVPLREKNKNLTSKAATNRTEHSKGTPATRVTSATAVTATARCTWKVPAHSGVPSVVSKLCQSPAPSKGVTKPRSTIKRRKLPKHSGVPVSFNKKKLALLLLDDE